MREALASSPDADMAVAAGENLYNDAVRRKLRGLRPGEWTRVRIETKGFSATAYVSVPGRPAGGSLAELGDIPDGRERYHVKAGGPRWLVSAPAGTDLRPLLAGLEERGVAPYVVSDIAQLGGSILASQLDAVRDADAVLVVLAEAAQSLNPVFEAGLAAALRKPLAVIAPPGASVPSGLAGFLIVRARPYELGAINFALDQAEAWVPATAAPLRPDIAWHHTGESVPGPASGGALGARWRRESLPRGGPCGLPYLTRKSDGHCDGPEPAGRPPGIAPVTRTRPHRPRRAAVARSTATRAARPARFPRRRMRPAAAG